MMKFKESLVNFIQFMLQQLSNVQHYLYPQSLKLIFCQKYKYTIICCQYIKFLEKQTLTIETYFAYLKDIEMDLKDMPNESQNQQDVSSHTLMTKNYFSTNQIHLKSKKQTIYMENQLNITQSDKNISSLNINDTEMPKQRKESSQKVMIRNIESNQRLKRLSSYKQMPAMLQNNILDAQYERKFTYKKTHTMKQDKKNEEMSQQTIKNKLPLAILDFIVKNAKSKTNHMTKSNQARKNAKMLGKLGLNKKINQTFNTKQCQICQAQVPEKQFQKMTNTCQHEYCSSCLNQYVIYKIKSFQQVLCPYQNCNQFLDSSTKVYKQLPLQVRKQYKKLLQYQMLKIHPNRKMCPQQKCQGWVDINQQIEPVCNLCRRKYCPKCMLQFHEGECDSKQLQFFQDTLHYRQCSKCKNVIQKSSGCIHMTCLCGNQFCYLCGAKWRHSHTCKNSEQQPILRQNTQCCCCQCDCEQCCNNCEVCCEDCCEDCCQACCAYDTCCGRLCEWCCSGQCCDSCCNCETCCQCECCQSQNCSWLKCIGKMLCKSLQLVLKITIVVPMVALLISLMFLFWIFATITAGVTVYTCEFICQFEQNYKIILATILYPFTMLYGIRIAFRQVFYDGFITQAGQICQGLCLHLGQQYC